MRADVDTYSWTLYMSVCKCYFLHTFITQRQRSKTAKESPHVSIIDEFCFTANGLTNVHFDIKSLNYQWINCIVGDVGSRFLGRICGT